MLAKGRWLACRCNNLLQSLSESASRIPALTTASCRIPFSPHAKTDSRRPFLRPKTRPRRWAATPRRPQRARRGLWPQPRPAQGSEFGTAPQKDVQKVWLLEVQISAWRLVAPIFASAVSRSRVNHSPLGEEKNTIHPPGL